jgi:hypothetical protein
MQKTSNIQPTKQCCVCDKKLFGRSDKVFCDIHCKNKYHQSVRKQTKTAAANTVKILKKNYVILCELLGDNCNRFKIKKMKLQEKGFNFEVISGMNQNKFGIKMEIFEFSWYFAPSNNIIVLQEREQSKISPYMYKRWKMQLEDSQTDRLSV